MGVIEMKQYEKYFAITVFMLFLTGAASNVLGINPAVKENDEIILDFDFSEPNIETFERNEQVFHRIKIDGLSNSGDINKPCLPVKPVKVLLPQGTTLDLSLIHI